MSSVATQNDFVRTRSMYSRRTIAKVFFQFMRASFDRAGLFQARVPDGLDVDLLEVGLLLREGLDGARVEGPLQEVLLGDAGRERDDEGPVDGFRGVDARESGDVGEAGVGRQ